MNKQVNYSIPKVGTTVVVIDNHMAIIQVKIGKNTIEHVLLDGGFGINIVTKHWDWGLGLPKPKPTPYNLRMEN